MAWVFFAFDLRVTFVTGNLYPDLHAAGADSLYSSADLHVRVPGCAAARIYSP